MLTEVKNEQSDLWVWIFFLCGKNVFILSTTALLNESSAVSLGPLSLYHNTQAGKNESQWDKEIKVKLELPFFYKEMVSKTNTQ